MHIGKWISGALAALVVSAPAAAAVIQAPVVVTLDAHDYVSYAAPSLAPGSSLLSVVDTAMLNCRRANGELPVSGRWKLRRATASLDVDFDTVRIEFNPTRLVLDSATHDIVCDGQAMGWQTGLGRVFRGDFDDA